MNLNGVPTVHENGRSDWEWLTVGEVAHAIGLTEERVRQLIRQRKIKATKIGGWLVQPNDLQVFIQSRTNIPGEE